MSDLKQGDVVVHGCLFRNRPLSAAERKEVMDTIRDDKVIAVARPVSRTVKQTDPAQR